MWLSLSLSRHMLEIPAGFSSGCIEVVNHLHWVRVVTRPSIDHGWWTTCTCRTERGDRIARRRRCVVKHAWDHVCVGLDRGVVLRCRRNDAKNKDESWFRHTLVVVVQSRHHNHVFFGGVLLVQDRSWTFLTSKTVSIWAEEDETAIETL